MSDLFSLNKKHPPKASVMTILMTGIFILTQSLSYPIVGQMVSINLDNASLKECINSIESQTSIGFLYQEKLISQTDRNININVKNEDIRVALDSIFSNTGLAYEIDKNVILIKETLPTHVIASEIISNDQQPIIVKGQVTDSKTDLPLPFVNVIIIGTSTGVATDADGYYTIEVKDPNATLGFSFLGYSNVIVPVQSRTIINVQMSEEVTEMDDVIVLGYGTMKKASVGSSVSQINGREIESKSVGSISFEQMLGGQIKGVKITQSSGAPGAASIVRVRGITSPFGGSNNQPLYVIDGIPFNTDPQFSATNYDYAKNQNPLLSVNPNDIASLTVLKDAASTAIYGSQGANGVIIINTKRGEKNTGIRTSLDYSLNLSNPIKRLELLDAEGYKKLHTMIARNTLDAYAMGTASSSGNLEASQVIDPSTGVIRDSVLDISTGRKIPVFGSANTDWQDEIYRKNAPMQQWSLNVSGGNRETNYSISVSHTNQEAIIRKSNFKKYGARLSIDSEANKLLKIGTTLNYNGSRDFSSIANTADIIDMFIVRPDYPIYDNNGLFQRWPQYWIYQTPGTGRLYYEQANSVAKLENETIAHYNSFIGSGYIEASLFNGFKLRADANTAIFKSRSRDFNPLRAKLLSSTAKSSLTNGANEQMKTSITFQANYQKLINKHGIYLMVGNSWDKANYHRSYIRYNGFLDEYVLTNAASAINYLGSEDGEANSGLNSIYGRLQYTYNDIYTTTINFRTDKSSKFGPGNKRAYFPSFAFNWNAHREKFLENINYLDKLVLRASYGRSGSANVSDFLYLQYFQSGTGHNKEYLPGETTIVPSGTYPNADIHWETTREFNFGFDFSVLSDRLFGNLDIYDKYTSGILVASPYPLESGASSFTSNLADVSNKGWELEMGANLIRSHDFTWSFSFNISANRNKVESMEGHALTPYQTRYFTVGQPIGVIKGYRVVKIIQQQSEIDALNDASPTGVYQTAYTGPGDYLYKDLNNDKTITAEDQEVIGSMEPDFFGGINTTISYKRLSLLTSFQFTVGSEAFWDSYYLLMNPTRPMYNASPVALNDTWTPDNPNAKYPRLIYGNHFNVSDNNDAILDDASFLRLKIIRLNYDVPENMITKLPLKSAMFYISATNLFTLTKFRGLDPEGRASYGHRITAETSITDAFPLLRTFSFGVRISL